MNRAIGVGAALCGLAFSARAASAATITVNTTNTGIVNDGLCGLREAVQASNTRSNFSGCTRSGTAAENIRLAVTPSGGATTVTYTVTSQIDITRSVIIRGNGLHNIISANLGSGGGFTLFRVDQLSGPYTVEFQDLKFQGGAGARSSAIDANGSSPTGRVKLLRSHVSQFTGGGIAAGRVSLEVRDSVIDHNTSPGVGAGIDVFGAVLELFNSSVWENTSEQQGGGIYLESEGNSRIVNSTISWNRGAWAGAGEFLAFNGGNLDITASTIVFNNAEFFAAGVHVTHSLTTNVRETLIDMNDIDGGIRSDWDGNITFLDKSLLGNTDGASIDSQTAENVLNQPSLINDLPEDYGGAFHTRIHRIGADSPAIDFIASSSLTEDQRHFPRGVDAIAGGNRFDIGAYEHDPRVQTETMLLISSTDTHTVLTGSAGTGYSNSAGTSVASNAVGDNVVYAAPVNDGWQTVRVGVRRGPLGGRVQVETRRPCCETAWTPLGVVDLWASTERFFELPLNTVTQQFIVSSGAQFRFRVIGRNSASSGYRMNLDYLRFIQGSPP